MTDTPTPPDPRAALHRRWIGGGDELPPREDAPAPDAPDLDDCDTGMDER